ncbi:hypothetical protein [Oscillatoria sp. FACHB-1406]|uniref:hypothetical protein n=1 Tax=Oscillatoria sp. FACHB-1406 TaxID=2692846 RepID=UPI001682313D|nr:hypothetical protein [Oscillatoria sp. FACHB-1406]MBD2579468.1 hypothetical protein [Oscillatoria sp. FACHB-1406]
MKNIKFKWYDPGEENPFPIRILDVRGFTGQVVAATNDIKLAESFNTQRQSDGSEYIDAQIENSTTVECNLCFPHNGDPLEGIIYKANSMDIKWDIYIYDSAFLFVRSWTGQLGYRAFAEITDTDIRINKVETAADGIETAPQDVYFMLGTHAMGIILPHTIPRDMSDDPQQIALWSFSMYGKFGYYATYEDITQIAIS